MQLKPLGPSLEGWKEGGKSWSGVFNVLVPQCEGWCNAFGYMLILFQFLI